MPSRGVRERLPVHRRGLTVELCYQGVPIVLGVGRYPDGRAGEVFLRGPRGAESELGATFDAWARTASTALQYGAPLAEVVDAARQSGGTDLHPVRCAALPGVDGRQAASLHGAIAVVLEGMLASGEVR